MKTRSHLHHKQSTVDPRLPKGVFLRAANRIGLTRRSLMAVAGLASNGLGLIADKR
jgi:hypothetical protein